ncbi:MAG TPA: hypothetical protein DCF68_23015 [Cyanothece sp. UBA12306]|nr:hypothetical protein [Cyanothece sp. UBA12306]
MSIANKLKKNYKKLTHKISRLVSDGIYRIKQANYRLQLPKLTKDGQKIVEQLNQEGIFMIPLEQLPFESNYSLLEALEKLRKDLIAVSSDSSIRDYHRGFKHCIPINPTKIARDYPELFLWGLDEKLLDIIENCIGLPVAYHGVIARKEIVDGQQIGSRRWHKDGEDRNIIRLTLYLNDVLDETAGPFEYIPRSLTPSYKAFEQNSDILDEHMSKVVPREKWKMCLGSKNTVVFGTVAKIFHHGKVPLQERMAVSFHYTSRNPLNEERCREFSFEKGIPLITAPLTMRQQECLWKYQKLLPKRSPQMYLRDGKMLTLLKPKTSGKSNY